MGKKNGAASPLDGMLDRGGKEIEVSFNPSVKLTNKKGDPGAYFRGKFVATRIVIQKDIDKKTGEIETKERPVHTFLFLESSAQPTIQEDGKYVPVALDEIQGKEVDVWGGGQLTDRLKRASEGDEVGIEYLGKEDVEGYPQPLNQFRVVIIPATASATAGK